MSTATGRYTDEEVARGERLMILEGVFSRAMEGVTGGVILAAFALSLGATDVQVGLIAAIPFLAQLMHVPAVALLERVGRRRLAVGASVASRLLLFLMAPLALVALPVPNVEVLLLLLVLYALFATLGGSAWQVWVREMVPRERLGTYFGRRLAILSLVGLAVLLAAGQFVSLLRDRGGRPWAFALLFVLGGVFGLVSAFILSRAPSRRVTTAPPQPLTRAIARPFKDRNYRRVLYFLGAWGFAANIALPFISVVLLRTVGYGLGVVTLLAALSQVANVAGLRLWSPLTDRFGNKPVLGLSASVFLVAMLAWALLPKAPGAGFLVATGVVHVLMGFSIAGLDVASNGVAMKLAPQDDAPGYLAGAAVVKALATGVAPLAGGLVATLLAGRTWTVQVGWTSPDETGVVTALRFVPHDLLFLASVGLGLYALHRLLGFVEEGEAPPEEVVRAMRREVAQPSSVAGLRTFAHAASYLIEAAYRFERAMDVKRAVSLEDEERDGKPGEGRARE